MKLKGFPQQVSSLAALAIAIPIATPSAAVAQKDEGRSAPLTAWEASKVKAANDKMSTGAARARDRLDSATSTSSFPENEITKLAPRSVAELFRNIPGIRVEAPTGETDNGYTVRGLPLVTLGSKYLQFQEDGLPVLEFGDFNGHGPDAFTRFDLNIGQVESIRGGSASTFASNAPGGVVNLISKTGEIEGGSVQATSGLDYESYRVDADYGGRLSDTVRFHVGGFYRRGTGARDTGFAGQRGGQVKFNITKQFSRGDVRLYGKYLDDRTPIFRQHPVAVTGTNTNPKFDAIPYLNIPKESLYSPNIPTLTFVDSARNVHSAEYSDGAHAKVKSIGVEGQFDIAGWSVSDRFRYSENANSRTFLFPSTAGTPAQIAAARGITGAVFTYASGPLQGQTFDATRGNGLLSLTLGINSNAPRLDDLVNDLRASRVWSMGGGDLTTTAGFYAARQDFRRMDNLSTIIQDLTGGGQSSLVNVAGSGGMVPLSQNGHLLFSAPGNNGNAQNLDVRYNILAPYGSMNFHRGKIAIGGSLRYDTGHVQGTAARSDAANLGCVDVNGNGVTGAAECATAIFPAANYRSIDYDYHYLSYSAGVNFRAAESLAFFARYSRGARAAAEAILFSPALDRATGHLLDRSASFDPVRQTEAGLKYRNNGVTFNLTIFQARTSETNTQINRDASGNSTITAVSRSYKARGAELEGGIRRGPFSVTASGTIADAEITAAPIATLIGKTPRHQPRLIYQVTPQVDLDTVSIGANVIGVTSSYANDTNVLKLPAYTTVGAFVQYSPVDKLVLSVNASNIFNTLAITETLGDAIPANNIIMARTLYGRTVSASARVFF